jgi:SAM-dependent methyltransferase
VQPAEPSARDAQAALAAACAKLFEGLLLLGPGSVETRRLVLGLVRAALPPNPVIADMGAGAGAASRFLADALPAAKILAVDRASVILGALGEADPGRVIAVNGDMAAPPLAAASLDLVWCESAIYAVGRGTALAAWRRLLRPKGLVVFSDVAWREPPAGRPPEAVAFWSEAYPEMQDADGIRAEIEAAGYAVTARHWAPASDWADYYAPLRQRLDDLAPGATPPLAGVLDEMRREVALFDAHGASYGVVFFVVYPALNRPFTDRR